jgi:hypothetical protein
MLEQRLEFALAGEQRLLPGDERDEADPEPAHAGLGDGGAVERPEGTVDGAEDDDQEKPCRGAGCADRDSLQHVQRLEVAVAREGEVCERVERVVGEQPEAEEPGGRRDQHRDQPDVEVVAGDRDQLEAEEGGGERRAEQQREDRADPRLREQSGQGLAAHPGGDPRTADRRDRKQGRLGPRLAPTASETSAARTMPGSAPSGTCVSPTP